MSTSSAPRSATGPTTRAPSARAALTTAWVFQGIGAFLFLYAGWGKVTGSNAAAVAAFEQLGTGEWFLVTVGLLELIGAVALLVPALAGLAALCLATLTLGAVVVELFVLDGGNPLPALVCFAVTTVVTVLRRRTVARPFTIARRALAKG
jgi:putative oxidoreductase